MEFMKDLITNRSLNQFGKELTNNATTKRSIIYPCITYDRVTTTKNRDHKREERSPTMNTLQPLKVLKLFYEKLLQADL
jgi:hypothetical protein